MNVIRTDDQIQQLIDALTSDLDLPDTDVFGHSNASAKAETRGFIRSLQVYLETRELPPDKYDEVHGWLIGASWESLGHDYGIN